MTSATPVLLCAGEKVVKNEVAVDVVAAGAIKTADLVRRCGKCPTNCLLQSCTKALPLNQVSCRTAALQTMHVMVCHVIQMER